MCRLPSSGFHHVLYRGVEPKALVRSRNLPGNSKTILKRPRRQPNFGDLTRYKHGMFWAESILNETTTSSAGVILEYLWGRLAESMTTDQLLPFYFFLVLPIVISSARDAILLLCFAETVDPISREIRHGITLSCGTMLLPLVRTRNK